MKLPPDATLNKQEAIALTGISLEDSYLIGFSYDAGALKLCLDLEFSIWPDSRFYAKPEPGEWTCSKKGQLIFSGVKEITGLSELQNQKPFMDPDGSSDWGCIYNMRIENGLLKFETEFNEIALNAEEMGLDIQG